MKQIVWSGSLAILVATGAGCEHPNNSRDDMRSALEQSACLPGQTFAAEESPLLLSDDEPLLLLDDASVVGSPLGAMADNSRCYVCHINYEEEDLALAHAQAEIGCADCHGESDEHIADESWASGGNGTAPDIMFPSATINPACLECHTKDTLSLDEHESLLSGANQEEYCTDCHGSHRLPQRKCNWK